MMEDQQKSKGTPASADATKAAKARHENRRRMLKAAVIAAPLIVTLRGKPAHAQLSSLGSAGILYGPGAYVQPGDVGGNITENDVGKALKQTGTNTFQILEDKTRRDQDNVESGKTITRD